MTRPSRPASSYSLGMAAAVTSNWRSSGETPTTWQRSPGFTACSWISTLRVETAPTMRTEWGTPAGIHTARSGGAAQAPCGVETTATPFSA